MRELELEMRDALKACVSSLDGLLGDRDLPEDDRPGVQAMQQAMSVLARYEAIPEPAELCHCGRRTINDGHGDPAPWCCGCNQSVAVCDCVPLTSGESR